MRNNAGKSNRNFILGAVVAGLIALAVFVPVRTCERCHGVAGFKVSDDIDFRCKGCGGKGKQTVLDIVIATVRK